MPIPILIADSDLDHFYHLKSLIHNEFPEYEIVGLARDEQTILRAIQEHRQAVIFLEIALCGIGGMEFVREAAKNVLVVLMSTVGSFAVKAFEYGVTDYLVKPVSVSRMRITLERLHQLLHLKIMPNEREDWISLWTHNGIRLLHPRDILYLQAEGNYVKVVCRDFHGLLRKPLHVVKKELGEDRFWQIHRQIVVNCEVIERLIREGEGGILILKKCPQTLRVSRNFVPRFLKNNFRKKERKVRVHIEF